MRSLISMIVAASVASAAHGAEPAADGKEVYRRWCASCHAAGERQPGTNALQAKYRGELPAVLTERRDLDRDVVKSFVRNGVSIMPSFRKTEITDAQLDALADYLAPKASASARTNR